MAIAAITDIKRDAELVKAMSRMYTRSSQWDARFGKNDLTFAEVEALESIRAVVMYEEFSAWWNGREWGSIKP